MIALGERLLVVGLDQGGFEVLSTTFFPRRCPDICHADATSSHAVNSLVLEFFPKITDPVLRFRGVISLYDIHGRQGLYGFTHQLDDTLGRPLSGREGALYALAFQLADDAVHDVSRVLVEHVR